MSKQGQESNLCIIYITEIFSEIHLARKVHFFTQSLPAFVYCSRSNVYYLCNFFGGKVYFQVSGKTQIVVGEVGIFVFKRGEKSGMYFFEVLFEHIPVFIEIETCFNKVVNVSQTILVVSGFEFGFDFAQYLVFIHNLHGKCGKFAVA